MELLPKKFGKMPGAIDLAFADPPFNIDWQGYTDYTDKLNPETYVTWCSNWIKKIYDLIHRHGTFWLAIGDEFVSELDVAAKRIGFHKRGHVIWYYTFGVACQKNFSRSHTHLLYYTRSKTQFTFNDAAVRVPSNRQLVYNDKRAKSGGKLPDNTWMLTKEAMSKCFGPDEDTWLVSRVAGSFKEREQRGTHKSKTRKIVVPQMPLAVLERIITACSNPMDVVIDPFLGTGTTGEAAVRLGREFWGCDISAQEVAAAKRRIARAAK